MAGKPYTPEKTLREMKGMESEFLLRLNRLDRITEELECRMDRIGKNPPIKMARRM